jgi:hypothetical protein
MKRVASFGCAVYLAFFTLSAASAQNKTDKLQLPPANVKIDGNLDEWGDSLRYYNAEKKLNYTLANDKDNLYITFRLNDRSEQARVLNAGLTISINTKGKKKADHTLTFPVQDPNSAGHAGGSVMTSRKPDETITQEDRDELMRARLTKLREINVTGFKEIEDGLITTSNTYGIKVAINYDANGYLVYEALIPLKFFGEYKADKDEWAFNFKINGLTKPTPGDGQRGEGGGGMGGGGGMRGGGGGGMGGGGMRGGGGGGRRGGGMGGGGGARGGETGSTDREEIFKSVDFWEKYYLGK